MTDFQILLKKFNNFKEYVKSVAPNKAVVADYENMSDNEFMLFGLGFLVPNKEKLNMIVDQICKKLGVTNDEHREKIKRYIECFIEYLEQLNNPEILKNTIVNIAQDRGIECKAKPPARPASN
jgi:RAB protein geranylgeranyltransferase component A